MEGSSTDSPSPKSASPYDDPVYEKFKGVLSDAEYVSLIT